MILQNIILNPAQLELLVQAPQEAADAAQSAETAAEDAANRAEAAAANINLPAISTGDPGQILTVKSDKSGYEYRTAEIVVTTRTILKALPVFIKSANLIEAGREGTFVLKAGSPPVADTHEGVYVVSNTAGYYWERIYAPAIAPTVRAFGAALDGSADDSAAINGALAVCGLAFVPWTATGFKAGGIVLSTNQEMKAERKTYWKLPASSSYGVRVTGYAGLIETIQGQFTRLSGFHMDAKDCPTTTTGVRFGLSSGVVYGFRMSDMNFTNFGEAIGDEAHATNYIVDLIIQDCACTFTRGRQVYSRRSAGFIQFKDFKVDHTLNSAPVTWEGARFEAVAGLELENFDVLGPALQNAYQASSIALIIVGIGGYNASVWLKRVLIDTTNGPGIHIENVYNVISENMGVHLTYGHSITLSGVSKGRFSNTSVLGAKGRPTPLAGAQGLRLVNCTGVRFVNTEVYDCTGHGIVLSDSISCQFTNTATRDNIGTGVFHSGTSNYNTFTVLSSLSNAGGSLTQVGGQSATVNWYPNSSIFTASTVGAATIA